MDTHSSTSPTLDSNEQHLPPREVALEVAYRLTERAFHLNAHETAAQLGLLEEARAWFELSGRLGGK